MNFLLQIIFIAIILATLYTPIYFYLFNGWETRYQEIVSSFPEDVVRRYFQTFFPNEVKLIRNTYVELFQTNYYRRFGRKNYLVPILLLLIIVTFCATLVAQTVLGNTNTLPYICIFALAGSYTWIVYEITNRVRKNDLNTVDLIRSSYRLVIAIPMGYAFAEIFKTDAGYAVAFILGGFPTRQLILLMRRIAISKLRIDDDTNSPGRELENLQGIGRSASEQFSDVGVDTILQLAYSDPIDLTIRTGFSFSYVVDCCSQALAWLSFEDDLLKLRKFGLRGAMEIRTFIFEIYRETGEPSSVLDRNEKLAKNTLTIVANELGMDENSLQRSLLSITWDPYNVFLYNVWQPSWN